MTVLNTVLLRDFYNRPPAVVARDLLGKMLWRETAEGRCGGRIVEVEAYEGTTDSAAHSYRGKTPRNASMFGPPGHAYVYSIHSRWCLNTVTEPQGVATAVLLRAIEPLIGLELMARRRSDNLLSRRARLAAKTKVSVEKGSGISRVTNASMANTSRRQRPQTPLGSILLKPRDLCRGPARLCEALAVTRQQDSWDLTLGSELWIETDPSFQLSPRHVARSPRIGISTAQDRLLRFFVNGNPFVSGRMRE